MKWTCDACKAINPECGSVCHNCGKEGKLRAMTPEVKKRQSNPSLEIIPRTLVPWSAAGPGWANSGCSFLARNPLTGKEERRTLYAEHFDGTLLAIAVLACGELERQAALVLEKARVQVKVKTRRR